MKPRVTYSRKWWRVHYGTNPHAVGVYGTWERAMEFANRVAQKGKEQ